MACWKVMARLLPKATHQLRRNQVAQGRRSSLLLLCGSSSAPLHRSHPSSSFQVPHIRPRRPLCPPHHLKDSSRHIPWGNRDNSSNVISSIFNLITLKCYRWMNIEDSASFCKPSTASPKELLDNYISQSSRQSYRALHSRTSQHGLAKGLSGREVAPSLMRQA